MIRFRHGHQAISLPPGELWAAEHLQAEVYRDTPAEELRSIVRDVAGGMPWREAVAQRYASSNPWLHQIITSPTRDLFFRQHPPDPGARVIDVGAGWGQIALPLARNCMVTALEPTPERLAFIQAAAKQEGSAPRMHYVQASLFDVTFDASFDLACCVGVLEWVPKFQAGDPHELQIAFLRRLHALLVPGGRLVIGIENRLGLKYLLGAPDDHLAAPNISVYDARLADRKWQIQGGEALRVFTFTRTELTEMLSAAGLSDPRFFAALPDYKLPRQILPLGPEVDGFFRQGGYVVEHDGSCGEPLSCQAELRSHYLSLAQLGIASDFVPSFYVSCQRGGN